MRATFTFRGSKISYHIHGKGSAILFIHGFLGSSELWRDQITDFKKSHRLILLDLPGHGKSESLGYMHSMEMLADLIHALLRELRIRKVILVGHSMGGYAALAFAEKYTDQLKALVLVNSTAAADSKSRKTSRRQLIKLLPKKKDQLIKNLLDSFFVIEGYKRRFMLNRYKRWADAASPQGIAASVKGMMERKEREIILKFAPYPYLIIAGEKDPIVGLRQNKKEAQLNPSGQLFILEDSGHISPLEKPWELNAALKQFIKGTN